MDTEIGEKVLEELKFLPQVLQRRVLEFALARAQSAPRGLPGRQLLRFAGSVSLDDIRSMSEAIERGCEQVDTFEKRVRFLER
ncbi:MAG: hypothetical protein WBG50_00755 [Desulfomonilaceae bacterium]